MKGKYLEVGGENKNKIAFYFYLHFLKSEVGMMRELKIKVDEALRAKTLLFFKKKKKKCLPTYSNFEFEKMGTKKFFYHGLILRLVYSLSG